MEDTAQPFMAAETDPNAQLADAAAAFKAFDNPVADRPRDDAGRFSREEVAKEEELDASEEMEEDSEGYQADDEEEEAAEEAQPMPPSWPADQAEQWASLPAETRTFLVNREAERERAVQAKFQESANVRKAAEVAAQEAQNRRDELARAFETVEALYQSPEPDPRAFGYGTLNFNEYAYRDAHQQWQQSVNLVAQFREQREGLQRQQAEQEAEAFSQWKQEHEATYAPKFVADVPELQTNAEPILRGLVGYAIANGIPESVFEESIQNQITSAQLHLLWKAQQYDKLRESKSIPQPKPKAGPVVKPGVPSPRSAQKASRLKRAEERLDREGSLEAAAALFKLR